MVVIVVVVATYESLHHALGGNHIVFYRMMFISYRSIIKIYDAIKMYNQDNVTYHNPLKMIL